MDAVVKLLFDILAFSSIMVLVVLGLAVIASMMGIFNLGHGELVLMGAYTRFVFRELGLPVWSGMIVAPFVVAILGAAIEVAFIRRLYAAPLIARPPKSSPKWARPSTRYRSPGMRWGRPFGCRLVSRA